MSRAVSLVEVNKQQEISPLSYVRRLALLSIYTTVGEHGGGGPHAAAASVPSGASDTIAARAMLQRAAPSAVRARLAGVAGLILPEADRPCRWRVAAGVATPDTDDACDAIAADHADAGLALAIDRYGVDSLFTRTIWLRLTAYVYRAGRRVPVGPMWATGSCSTFPRLIAAGYMQTDEWLAAQSADEAARSLVATLLSGRSPRFAADARAMVVPASVPSEVSVTGTAGEARSERVPSLDRQSDVLFQPGFPPVVAMVSASTIRATLKAMDVRADRLWRDRGQPAQDTAMDVAHLLSADYVLLSRVSAAGVTETPEQGLRGSVQGAGISRRASVEVEAVLLEVASGLVSWRHVATADSVAITEYVRGRARIRTVDQCVVDAARAAYAQLRSSFHEFARKPVDRPPAE